MGDKLCCPPLSPPGEILEVGGLQKRNVELVRLVFGVSTDQQEPGEGM